MPSPKRLAVTLVALALGLTPTLGVPAVEGLQETEPVAESDVIRLPFIIETSDPGIDPASDETVLAFNSLMETIRPDPAQSPPEFAGLAAATTGQITVSYQGSIPPADVQNVVNRAVADWNSVLSIPGNAPVVIDFYWIAMESGFLGGARPLDFYRNRPGLPSNDFYPSALANALTNSDLSSESEIEVSIASNLYGTSTGWFSGTGSVPNSKIDLYSTISHEIGHGLGFYGTAYSYNGSSPELDATPVVYDRLTRYNGTSVVNISNLNTALTSSNLFIDIGGGRLHELYAPFSFRNGSSFSHFDESYAPGQPGSMMSPALGRGQTDRTIDAAILGVMSNMGWATSVSPLVPAVSGVTAQSHQLSTSWNVDLSQVGLPPIGFVVEARQGSNVAGSAELSWNATSASVGSLTNFEDYELVVSSIGLRGQQSSVSIETDGSPYLLQATGSGLSRTLHWQPMTSPGSNSATYELQRSKDGGAFRTIGTTSGTSLVDTSLSPGVFQYRLTGSSNGGTSHETRSLFIGVTTSTVRPFALDGQVARLYEAYFGRDPDSSGMAHWSTVRANGMTLEQLSATFEQSPEFVARFGDVSNADFVHLVYTEVIGRPAESEGFNYWLGQLNAGMSRGALMIGFSEASEYITKTGTVAPQSSVEAEVYRLYVAYFLRSPDPSGFSHWVGQANAGVPIEQISAAFASGAEFQSRYGSLSNDDFIELVYRNVLTREAEGSGQGYWLGLLDASTSRGDVMVGFSNSPEFLLATGTLP